MYQLEKGNYFGVLQQVLQERNIILTDIDYVHDQVDWHYHANPYFTYLIAGGLFEANRKEDYHLTPGKLVYHNWQDAHYNRKQPGYARGFHVEVEQCWFERHMLPLHIVEGSLQLEHPEQKTLFDKIYLETKICDQHSFITIEMLLVQLLDNMQHGGKHADRHPAWVKTIREILHEAPADSYTLLSLAGAAQVHPVHLSREFPRYFSTTLGDYLRRIKVTAAAALLKDNALTLTDISYRCGFADQSHFIRCFRRYYQMAPLQYRRLMGC
ncbi:helix-turn-helix transcriptional regulator [Chitinophaga sp. Mgbs1]|uniref:Helix-turn-helix transcriptional regulator n=1 Tax=Chitinophaga solisilvae TaxID=1233460 RepID=A0A433WIF6_9BACT|nr:helix-turn-helix transcriptional regulator [Chitinophaga solisilvae]